MKEKEPFVSGCAWPLSLLPGVAWTLSDYLSLPLRPLSLNTFVPFLQIQLGHAPTRIDGLSEDKEGRVVRHIWPRFCSAAQE